MHNKIVVLYHKEKKKKIKLVQSMVNFKSKHDYCVLTKLKPFFYMIYKVFTILKNNMKGHIIDTQC